MDKKTETWMMSPEGIKAIWDRFDSIDKQLAFLTNWLAQTSVDLENQSKQPTTVEPTQTAPTTEEPSAVEALTDPMTQPSSQSDPVGIKSGPVEQSSECAHEWIIKMWESTLKLEGRYHCQKCNAPKWFVVTPAQDVAPILSTLAKQPSKESVENSVEESVKSPSKELTKDQLHWLDVGGEMALTTVKGFIEGRLAIKRYELIEGTNICKICNKRKPMLQDESICFECSSRSK